ncbi:MAG: UDP-3-O-acyl-N-acetylglucosamine deacetylase [Deltaproteobacteria bacterium]|nr:UDP-3-O-acyl-N-acetylglucosamine deacetylase [Deltaproteobacteria bacterium]
MTLYDKQNTIASPVTFSGVGVHSGKEVHLTVMPAPENHGIRFCRVDLPAKPVVTAHFNRVVDTSLATVIGDSGCIVSTIEHLMATFSGLSIDNALIELDGHEVPIMDGSAAVFAEAIRRAGIKGQDAGRPYFVIKRPIVLEKDGKSVCAYPGLCRKMTCTIAFDNPVIGEQTYCLDITRERFENEIARARTFGFFEEIELLKFYGLGKGGSLDNAVVINGDAVMNKEGLRYADEFVRHKILDAIGDFSLMGMPILGHLKLYKSGHNFNHAFLTEFFKQKDCWDTMTLEAYRESLKPDLLETA